jgi:hypothetical protein
MHKGEPPVFRISAGTAFKAGFFGAIGFLVGQVVIVGVVGLVFVGLLGFSLGAATNSMGRWKEVPPKLSAQTAPQQASPVAASTPVEPTVVAEASTPRTQKPAVRTTR